MTRLLMIWVLIGGLVTLAVGTAANVAAGRGCSVATSLLPQCGLRLRLDVHPARPGSGDEVVVIAGGEWRDSCVPTYLVPRLNGQVVRVEAVLDYPAHTGCLCVITLWRLSAEVGRLPQGLYRVDLYTTDAREPGISHHCASRWLAVGGELHLLYLPAIMGSGDTQDAAGASTNSSGATVQSLPRPRSTPLRVHSGR